jgi:hypothetical protein
MLLQIGWLHLPAKISVNWLHEPANRHATELSVEEACAIVNLLPECSEAKRVPQFVVRNAS